MTDLISFLRQFDPHPKHVAGDICFMALGINFSPYGDDDLKFAISVSGPRHWEDWGDWGEMVLYE